jgi:hypoxanthine phosphoribosyltransferase
LSYAIRELEKDVSEQAKKSGRTDEKTEFGIFVLHNKNKPKKGHLSEELTRERYWAAEQIGDLWVLYVTFQRLMNSVNILGRRGTLLNILRRQKLRRLRW